MRSRARGFAERTEVLADVHANDDRAHVDECLRHTDDAQIPAAVTREEDGDTPGSALGNVDVTVPKRPRGESFAFGGVDRGFPVLAACVGVAVAASATTEPRRTQHRSEQGPCSVRCARRWALILRTTPSSRPRSARRRRPAPAAARCRRGPRGTSVPRPDRTSPCSGAGRRSCRSARRGGT